MIEHLADRLTDQVQLTAATGAGLMFKIEPHVLARQMHRQAWSIGPHSRRLGARQRKRGFSPRDVRLEVFEAELELVIIEPFGASAKLTALQILNDEPEPLDLCLCFSEVGAFRSERANHTLQRLYIVRQGGKIDVHERGSSLRGADSSHMPRYLPQLHFEGGLMVLVHWTKLPSVQDNYSYLNRSAE
jgi:hypothetical protein